MDKSTKVTRENLGWLLEQPLAIKVGLIQQHLSICQLVINQILEEDVRALSGERYSHEKPHEGRYSRYGFNPGSVRIGDKKVKVEVPKVRDTETGQFHRLKSYGELKELDGMEEQTLQGVLHGLSTRDYQGVIDHLEEGFGLSKSAVSRKFIQASAEKLKEFEARDLSNHRIMALFIDGKYMARQQMMIVMGITETGDKVILGLLQTTNENSIPIGDLFIQLKERGLQYQEGLLFIVDGSKGIQKAIKDQFGDKALIQRCIWHKRENVMSYLSEKDQPEIKKEYHRALAKTTYAEAKMNLMALADRLEKMNRQAANSLLEGLEELLTLHKLEMAEEFSTSFSTTNCIESVNAQIKKYAGRVTHWSSSNQRYRWVASALIEIEHRMRKVDNFKELITLKNAIYNHLKNQTSPS